MNIENLKRERQSVFQDAMVTMKACTNASAVLSFKKPNPAVVYVPCVCTDDNRTMQAPLHSRPSEKDARESKI